MPYDNLTDVQKEAYVNSDADLITLSTLEIYHPNFTSSLKIVRDSTALSGAKIESGAPEAPGSTVTFQAFWFEFVPPEIDGQPDPTFDISVVNASGAITPYLESATESIVPIGVVYRTYLYDSAGGGLLNGGQPSADPFYLEAFTAETQGNMAVFKIIMAPIGNRSFPSYRYTPEEFPGLLTL